MRGVLLLMMMVAHYTHLVSSHVQMIHQGHFMPVFDGEFFVFISGLVCAFAYQGTFAREGVGGCLRAVSRRVRWLYLYQVLATLLVLAVLNAAWPLVIYPEYTPSAQALSVQLLRVMTLSLQPRFLDILMLYMALMLFIPVALALLTRGRARLFFAVIIGCWLLAATGVDGAIYVHVTLPAVLVSHSGFVRGTFNPWSYALLFYGAFYLGFRFKQLGKERFTATIIVPRTDLFVAASVVNVGFAVLEVGKHVLGTPEWVYYPARDTISPVGLLSTVSASYMVYYLLVAKHRHRALQTLATWLRGVLTAPALVTIGSSSLFVYSIHGLIIMGGVAILTASGALGNRWATDVVVLASGMILWSLARFKKRHLPTLP